jgi:hypothetical protein
LSRKIRLCGPIPLRPPTPSSADLLVEDDEVVKSLPGVSSQAGFTVELAENGRLAVEKLRLGVFDLV